MPKGKKKGVLTVSEAADDVNVTEQTVRKWLTDRDLRGHHVGKKMKWYIREKDWKEFKKKWGYDSIESEE